MDHGASSCTLKSEPVRATVAAKEHPAVLSPDPLEQLKRENERFCQGRSIHQHQDTTTIHWLVSGQHPQVVVIRCSDFRVLPEIVFDQGSGDLFTIRTAGPVMSDVEEGSMEYAVEHLHSLLVVVPGHQGCGATGAMLGHVHDDQAEEHIAAIVQALMSESEEQEVLCEGERIYRSGQLWSTCCMV